MARNSKTTSAIFLATVVSTFAPLGLAQQSSLQTSFLTPASVHLSNAGIEADILETVHLPYLTEVSREAAKQTGASANSFLPSASDLLIQQAEERFRNGRRFLRNGDYDQARTEFDAAIDAMLRASDNPTDRRLFDSKMEDMVDTIHRADLSGLGGGVIDEASSFDKAPLDDLLNMTFPVDPRMKDRVQTEIRHTASELPLVVNDVVLGYINYFAGRGHRTIEGGMERAGQYSAMISRVLSEEGIPQELIHLAQAESGFLPRALSRAAAAGMWQFVKFRGNQYGLMQTPYSDDRLDPEKATRAAAHHLHDLYNEFGDWYLAIAAYNCGPGGIERAVERTGYADFWELRARHAIPNETANYVPIILAMTIMAKNAPEYGLDHVSPAPAIEYDTIATPAQTNLALVADLADSSTPELRALNPALLRNVAPANFEVRVPKGTGDQVSAILNQIPTDRLASARMHRVETGESFATIARQYNSTPRQIATANEREPDVDPAPGERLIIPAAFREPVAAPRSARAPVRTASAHPANHQTVAAKKKSTTAAHTVSAPARRPIHTAAGTLAELKRPALNR